MVNETTIKVRYVETDQMGIVHHSNYYTWFEIGRCDFLRESGMTYRAIEQEGIMLPLVDSYCKYIEGAKYDDLLTVITRIEEMNGAKIVFNYDLVRHEDNKIIAKGKTTHAFVNQDFNIINVKKANPKVWETLQSHI